MRENAECVKKLFHTIRSHLAGDRAHIHSLSFQIRVWELRLIGGPVLLRFQRLKWLSAQIRFRKSSCQFLHSGCAPHFNMCFLLQLDWTFALVAHWETLADNNCVIVKPKSGSHAALHMCLVSNHISGDLLISNTAKNGFFHAPIQHQKKHGRVKNICSC